MIHTIGIGVIGMGWMGEAHSRSYRAIPDRFLDSGIRPHLLICADPIESRARAAQERFGFAHATTDWREVIAHPAVQAISITAPNGMHLEIVQAAAAAGKHILCEKPVGRFPQETLAAAAAAQSAGVISAVGFNYRWAPVVQYARQLVAAGKLGRLTHYHGRFLNGYAGNPNAFLSWRFAAAQGLGVLGDLMSHVIDMAHMIAGPVATLTSDKQIFIQDRPIPQPGVGTHYDVGSRDAPRGPVTNEDYVSALVRFANGARGYLESCRVINGAKCDMSFEIHGDQGAIKWSFERMNELQLQWRNDANPAEDGFTTVLSGPAHPFHSRFNPGWATGLGYDDLKAIEAFNFLHAVVTGQQGEPGLAEAAAVARVQQAMIRSWQSGAWEEVG